MTSIKDLYSLPEVSEGHRDFFWTQVTRAVVAAKITSKSYSVQHVAIEHLKQVTQRYDSGGHSMGRSLRSFLLEHVVYMMSKGGKGSRSAPTKILPVLFAMYHNRAHIVKYGWHDYFLESETVFWRDPEIRIHLAVALILLGLDKNIPDISKYVEEDFLSLVED